MLLLLHFIHFDVTCLYSFSFSDKHVKFLWRILFLIPVSLISKYWGIFQLSFCFYFFTLVFYFFWFENLFCIIYIVLSLLRCESFLPRMWTIW